MPRMSTGGAEKLVSARFGEPIYEWLRDRAHEKRVTISELIRVAVIAHYGSEPGFPANEPAPGQLSQQ